MWLAKQDWDLSLMEGITTKMSCMHVGFLASILLKSLKIGIDKVKYNL